MQDHTAVAGDDECRCAWGQWVGEIAGQFTRAVVTETARRELAAKWRRFSQATHSPQRRRHLLDAVQQQFVLNRLQSEKAVKDIPHRN